jgi:hypothetical protein
VNGWHIQPIVNSVNRVGAPSYVIQPQIMIAPDKKRRAEALLISIEIFLPQL